MLQYPPLPKENHTPVKLLLLVEDDASIAEALVLALTLETPHQVLVASSGPDALHLLGSITPDLIFLDYHLPSMNGLAFYDLLRRTKGQEETPVVFVSADTSAEVVRPIKERNAVLLAKPFDLDEFFALIEQTTRDPCYGES